MKKINDCIEETGRKKVFTRKEKGKSFTLISEEEFNCSIVGIDKCVFGVESGKRCDFLFLSEKVSISKNCKKAFYVELKGEDLRIVCEQLFNGIKQTKPEINGFEIEARVVTTNGLQPRILNSQYFRRVKKLIGKEIVFCKVHRGNNFNHQEKLI
jgi:hypothetical protein